MEGEKQIKFITLYNRQKQGLDIKEKKNNLQRSDLV